MPLVRRDAIQMRFGRNLYLSLYSLVVAFDIDEMRTTNNTFLSTRMVLKESTESLRPSQSLFSSLRRSITCPTSSGRIACSHVATDQDVFSPPGCKTI
jgi:hypothetical protein